MWVSGWLQNNPQFEGGGHALWAKLRVDCKTTAKNLMNVLLDNTDTDMAKWWGKRYKKKVAEERKRCPEWKMLHWDRDLTSTGQILVLFLYFNTPNGGFPLLFQPFSPASWLCPVSYLRWQRALPLNDDDDSQRERTKAAQ